MKDGKNLLNQANWNGKTILMLGAARQGQAVIRYAIGKGAHVILNDRKPFDKLTDEWQALRDLPIRWVTGGHPIGLLDEIDAIGVTGGADLRIPILREAASRGIPILNDTQLFLNEVNAVKAPVIGITGSSGKTTTTTLVGRIAKNACETFQAGRKVWLGGNIGNPLLTEVDKIQPADVVILELSSFQLELTTISPQIAAVLNITPNHLDRHGTMEAYTEAKMNILRFQDTSGTVILNRDDAGSWALRQYISGKLISFGMEKPSELTGRPEAALVWLENGVIRRWCGGQVKDLLRVEMIRLRGTHNIFNVMAACAIATAAEFPIDAMQKGVENFAGVHHRLEWVRTFRGADWYNDSIATAPERTLAAIHSFTQPLVLLLGGRDKNLPWETLAAAVRDRARAVVLFGEAGPLIETVLQKEIGPESAITIRRCQELEEAVQAAASLAQAGDVVLLSPGGTSYDAFKDFEERGKAFIEWVLQLK